MSKGDRKELAKDVEGKQRKWCAKMESKKMFQNREWSTVLHADGKSNIIIPNIQ